MAGKPRTPAPTGQYVQGLMAAQIALAEIVRPMKSADMPEQLHDFICKINIRLCELCLEEIQRQDDARR
jgi:hypothetical protein